VFNGDTAHITQLKRQKSKKVLLLRSTLTSWRRAVKVIALVWPFRWHQFDPSPCWTYTLLNWLIIAQVINMGRFHPQRVCRRSGSRMSSEGERSGERCKCAAQNPPHRIASSLMFKVVIQLSVQSHYFAVVCCDDITHAKKCYFRYAAFRKLM